MADLGSLKARLASTLPVSTKLRMKQLIRKARFLFSKRGKLELSELEFILANQLGINAGDALLVHSSFGYLNANFSPKNLVTLLKTMVTPDGLIVMPYYPPLAAVDWLQRNEVFDHRSTASSMGVLTTLFKDDPEVHVSAHPIKALTAWGKNAASFVEGHHRSITPFDAASPYAKLKSIENAKSIGIGIERCTFIHHCEDSLLGKHARSFYLPESYTGRIICKDGCAIDVTTLVHDPLVIRTRELSCSYFRRHGCPTFIGIEAGLCSFYSVSIPQVYAFMKERWCGAQLDSVTARDL